jgi:hypothetical protein
MKIKPTKKHNKKIIRAFIFLLIVISLTLYYLSWLTKVESNVSEKVGDEQTNSQSNQSINYSEPSSDQKDNGDEIKNNILENINGNPETQEKKNNLEVIITSNAISNSTLRLRVQINSIESEGVCSLSLKDINNRTLFFSAELLSLASTSTCAGFDIPTSELTSGVWTAIIDVENSSKRGTASKVITIGDF